MFTKVAALCSSHSWETRKRTSESDTFLLWGARRQGLQYKNALNSLTMAMTPVILHNADLFMIVSRKTHIWNHFTPILGRFLPIGHRIGPCFQIKNATIWNNCRNHYRRPWDWYTWLLSKPAYPHMQSPRPGRTPYQYHSYLAHWNRCWGLVLPQSSDLDWISWSWNCLVHDRDRILQDWSWHGRPCNQRTRMWKLRGSMLD